MGKWNEGLEWREMLQIHKHWILTFHYFVPFGFLVLAILSYKGYKTSCDKKDFSKGDDGVKWLRLQTSKGALNEAPLLWFGEAQRHATLGKPLGEIKNLFDKAITGLYRSAFHGFEAVCCELFAEFALKKNDREYARDYYQRAHRLYLEWGAGVKVSQLEQNHGDLLTFPDQ